MEAPNGKGKGKEVTADPQHPSSPPPDAEGTVHGLVSRLTASASALTNSVLGAAPSTADLAASSSGKGARGRSGQHTREGELAYQESRADRGGQASFASTPGRNHKGDSDFASFLAGDPGLPAVPGGIGESQGDRPVLDAPSTRPTPAVGEPAVPAQGLAVSAQADHDGLEVVELLSRSDFDAQWQSGAAEDDDPDERSPSAVLGERETARLGSALFGDGAGGGARREDWAPLLDFVPAQFREPGERPLHGDMVALLGVTDGGEARDIWFSQWGRVLNRYTDEVWGDLSPLVQEAREEVERSRATDAGGASAVKKLRTVLARVRARL